MGNRKIKYYDKKWIKSIFSKTVRNWTFTLSKRQQIPVIPYLFVVFASIL
jgi:hypothetical protein